MLQRAGTSTPLLSQRGEHVPPVLSPGYGPDYFYISNWVTGFTKLYPKALTMFEVYRRSKEFLPGHTASDKASELPHILRSYVRRYITRQESFVLSVHCFNGSPIIFTMHVRIAFI